MSIHAKSHNHLVADLEVRCQPKPTPMVEPCAQMPKDMTWLLEAMQQVFRDTCHKIEETRIRPAASKSSISADAPYRTVAPPPEERPPTFTFDSTLGVRTRPAGRMELRKTEADLRLYPSFASRSDITG